MIEDLAKGLKTIGGEATGRKEIVYAVNDSLKILPPWGQWIPPES